MKTTSCGRLASVLALLALGVAWSACPAQDRSPAVEPAEAWRSVFAGKDADSPAEVDFPLAVTTPGPFKGRLAWSLLIGNATVQAGEASVTTEAGRRTRVKLPLRIPFIREGLVVEGKLTAVLVGDREKKPAARFERPLWIASRQPFVQRTQWLKGLKIALFDPRETTAPVLKKMAIPFTEVRDVAALGELKEGLILVGEGISFEEERALPETLIRAAARGLPVLWLAPAQGVLPLPGADDPTLPAPASVSFRRQDIITQLDKRLDAHGWPGAKVTAAALALKAVDGRVAAEATDGASGWPWVEIGYPNQGRLLVCGFGLIRHWEAGPTPRFLFAHVLEHLTAREGRAPP
jgi:hypothetical protein